MRDLIYQGQGGGEKSEWPLNLIIMHRLPPWTPGRLSNVIIILPSLSIKNMAILLPLRCLHSTTLLKMWINTCWRHSNWKIKDIKALSNKRFDLPASNSERGRHLSNKNSDSIASVPGPVISTSTLISLKYISVKSFSNHHWDCPFSLQSPPPPHLALEVGVGLSPRACSPRA